MTSLHPELGSERALALLSAANVAHLPEFKQLLSAVFPHLDVVAPRDLLHLAEVIKRSRDTHRVVIGVGGDGFLHHVLQSIDLAAQVMAVVPGGTGNDFAHTLQYPRGRKAAVDYLASLKEQPTDYGVINGRRFLNSAGFGLDSETLKVRHRSRGLMHRNYLAAFVYVLATLRPRRCRVLIDQEELAGSWYWILVMNTPFIGGGTMIAPQATICDGLLDVVLIRQTSKLNLLRCMPAAVKGRHLGLSYVVYRQARQIQCYLDSPLDSLAEDGEELLCAEREVTMSVHPAGLRLLR